MVDADQTIEIELPPDLVTMDIRKILRESKMVHPIYIGELTDTLASYTRALLKLTQSRKRADELIGSLR